MRLKSLVYALALVMTVGAAGCQTAGKKGDTKLTTKNDSVSYALGILMGESTKQQLKGAPGLDSLDKNIIVSSFQTVFKGDSVNMKPEAANELVQKFFTEVAAIEATKTLKAGEDFLAANKTKQGVVTTASGLQYEIIKEGTGPKPTAADQVKCNYVGTTIEGKEFDSSTKNGGPATFPVGQVIPGWTEALQLMPVGSKWKLYIPAALGYGERGAGADIKPNSALIFEVELLEIVKN